MELAWECRHPHNTSASGMMQALSAPMAYMLDARNHGVFLLTISLYSRRNQPSKLAFVMIQRREERNSASHLPRLFRCAFPPSHLFLSHQDTHSVRICKSWGGYVHLMYQSTVLDPRSNFGGLLTERSKRSGIDTRFIFAC